jgi:alkanesulfonate monooxygenase SsuD/methylene tetrahydromethanopterin reductase-like flavin-dependent oxidoreductase (luciferase family)
MSRPPLRFGLFLGQSGKTWPQVADAFRRAEDLGFDHAWLVDHLIPTDGPDDVQILEAWTLLGALAARTERLTLGTLVTNNLFRNPALLAKQAATVDAISGGRLILGLGSGWFEREHRAYGFEFPAAGERVDRFEEAIHVVRALHAGGRSTFRGRFYRLDDAPFAPLPASPGGIPLLIAAHRPRMLAIAARHADIWDTFPETAGAATEGVAEGVAAQAARFEAAVVSAGRDPSSIRRSTWIGGRLASSVEAYEDFVRRHHRLGFTDLTIGLPDGANERVLRDIAGRAIPALRAELDVA